MERRVAGLSLVDAVIAAAIVVVAIGVAYPGFRIANDTIAVSTRKDSLERAADRILDRVIEEIRSGRILAVAESPEVPSVTLNRPGRGFGIEDLDTDGATPWQSTNVILRFRRTGTFQESAEGRDLNRDGDLTDSFALGVLEIVENGRARPLTRRGRILLGLPGYEGDVDGDGEDDPLFRRDGRRFTIDVHVLDDTRGEPLIATAHGQVHLRNVQE